MLVCSTDFHQIAKVIYFFIVYLSVPDLLDGWSTPGLVKEGGATRSGKLAGLRWDHAKRILTSRARHVFHIIGEVLITPANLLRCNARNIHVADVDIGLLCRGGCRSFCHKGVSGSAHWRLLLVRYKLCS